jgi:glycosyltransferase involved in cell wall biosynthesis
VEIVTVVSSAARSLSSVATLEHPPIIISHTVSDVFFKVRAQHSTPLRLLFVGELSEKKGVQALPKLLDDLRDQAIAIDIVGDGPLREIAIEIARRPNCCWHGQVTDRSKLAAIAGNCQILVSPALSTNRWEELFGMSILEAMATGLVCIVTDHVGPRSIIHSGVDGILVPENSTDAIASSIRELQANPKQWAAISEQALATAKKYSLQEIAWQWNRLLLGAAKDDAQQVAVKERPSTQVLASA